MTERMKLLMHETFRPKLNLLDAFTITLTAVLLFGGAWFPAAIVGTIGGAASAWGAHKVRNYA